MAVTNTAPPAARTVSHIFGEITWLLSESPQHRDLRISELASFVMPPILHRQYHIFRKGDRPVGAALWAYMDEAAETSLEQSLLQPALSLPYDAWKSGESLWLIALIAPFSDVKNREAELMLADLIAGPFAQTSFRMIHFDSLEGERAVLRIAPDAKQKLVDGVKAALEAKG